MKSLIVRDKLDGKGGEGARPPVFLKSCFHPPPSPSPYLPISWENRFQYLTIKYTQRHIYLSIYLPVCLSICISVCLSDYLSIYLSIHLSIYLSVFQGVCLYVYSSVYLSICLSTHLSIYLSLPNIFIRSLIYLSINSSTK